MKAKGNSIAIDFVVDGTCSVIAYCWHFILYKEQWISRLVSVKYRIYIYFFKRSTHFLCLEIDWLWGQQAGECWCGICGTWVMFSSEENQVWSTRPAVSERFRINRYGNHVSHYTSAEYSLGIMVVYFSNFLHLSF